MQITVLSDCRAPTKIDRPKPKKKKEEIQTKYVVLKSISIDLTKYQKWMKIDAKGI